MVGNRLGEHIDFFDAETGADQDVIEYPGGLPAGVGAGQLSGVQFAALERGVIKQILRMGIHVAHEHHVLVVSDAVSNIGQLIGPAFGAECEVHHDHKQGVLPFAKAGQYGAAARQNTRELVIFEVVGGKPAEQTIGVLSKTPQVAIQLLIPEGELTFAGQVFDLIDVTRPNTAAVDFLQGDQIKVAQYPADLPEHIVSACSRQQVLPATREVVMIFLGIDAYLNVEAQEFEHFRQANRSCRAQIVGLQVARQHLAMQGTSAAFVGRSGLRHALACLALLIYQVVCHLKHAIEAAYHAALDPVFTVHNQGWNAGGPVSLGQTTCFGHFAAHTE